MYAQAAIKPNTLLRNGAYGIVMRDVQKCTCAGASLRGRNSAPLCCIKLDTATDPACGSGVFLVEAYRRLVGRWILTEKPTRILPSQLIDIMENCIFGVDCNTEAVRVASFSLSLAMCDFLEPRTKWNELQIPR